MDGTLGTHERRMDFVRFSGEWVIYYVLIALGGGVLVALTALILDPIGSDLAEGVVEWVLPSGAAGAVIVAAWLVESKQQVVENMAPVLTMVFTPLFAVMLTVAAVTYAVFGVSGAFDRDLLGVFDALLVVVVGLVLYAMSAREPSRPAGLMDRVELVAIVSALVLDVMVLVSMVARVGDLGFTPNRAAALGLNLVLFVNLAGAGWRSLQFSKGRMSVPASSDGRPPRSPSSRCGPRPSSPSSPRCSGSADGLCPEDGVIPVGDRQEPCRPRGHRHRTLTPASTGSSGRVLRGARRRRVRSTRARRHRRDRTARRRSTGTRGRAATPA